MKNNVTDIRTRKEYIPEPDISRSKNMRDLVSNIILLPASLLRNRELHKRIEAIQNLLESEHIKYRWNQDKISKFTLEDAEDKILENVMCLEGLFSNDCIDAYFAYISLTVRENLSRENQRNTNFR